MSSILTLKESRKLEESENYISSFRKYACQYFLMDNLKKLLGLNRYIEF